MINLGSSSIKGIRLGTQRVSAIYLGETAINFNSGYNVGEYYPDAGGYIFWLNGTGGGQVALYQNAPSGSIIPSQEWGSVVQNVAGTFANVSSGSVNTTAMSITSGSNRIWSTIQNLNSSSAVQNAGFNDWYIPSIDALGYMYDNLVSQNIGGPYIDPTLSPAYRLSLWSSTQSTTANAWLYIMKDTIVPHGPSDLNRKDTRLPLRPVRTFTSGSI
jgi:hypothetical protein